MAGMKIRDGRARVWLFFVLFLAGPGMAARALAAETETPTPQPVILDTDIGDDIDDAFALALALESPELKILGVTTTFGDTELRARLLDRYLEARSEEH